MPNWCCNELTVTGPESDVAAFKERAVGHDPWPTEKERASEPPSPLNFHSLVPVPEDLLRDGYGPQAHEWEKAHWGCKWGACHDVVTNDSPSCLAYLFDTAWVPPAAFLKAVAQAWPTLTFVLSYDECGMGFKGVIEAHGEEFNDQCLHY